MNVNGEQMVALNMAPTVESRDYLEDGGRVWGDGGIMTLALDDESGLKNLQSNSYSYANPVVTDDGQLVAYLSDGNSTDVTKTHVAWGALDGTSYADKGAVADGEADAGYGDSQLTLAGTDKFAVAAWSRQMVDIEKEAGSTLTADDQKMMLDGTDAFASIYANGLWTTINLSGGGSADLAPVVATNGKSGAEARAIVAWRSVSSSGKTVPTDAGVQADPALHFAEQG